MKRLCFLLVFLLNVFIIIGFSCNNENDKREQTQKQISETTADSVQINKNNFTVGKEVVMSSAEQKKLNVFFSNFSEVGLEPFTEDNIIDEELIKFGILHNFINNYNLFLPSGNDLKLKDDVISESVEKYFGKTFTAHKSTRDYKYKNGYYFVLNADGEAYTFSQVTGVNQISENKYVALINIYTASSGWTGDEHANPGTWNNKDEDKPELTGKFKATFSKTTGKNGEVVYKLIDYIKQ